MLETVGLALIGAAIAVLLLMMVFAWWPWFERRVARPAVAESLTAGLAAMLAVGVGLTEFGLSATESEPHWAGGARFALLGGAFVLLWLWLHIGRNRRA